MPADLVSTALTVGGALLGAVIGPLINSGASLEAAKRNLGGQRTLARDQAHRQLRQAAVQPILDLVGPDTVLAKIADQVHSGAQQLQFVDFVLAARASDFTVCDYTVKTRSAGIEDPKWTHRYHVRKPWSFWVVARSGTSCTGPGASLLRICSACNLPFKAAARTQSPAVPVAANGAVEPWQPDTRKGGTNMRPPSMGWAGHICDPVDTDNGRVCMRTQVRTGTALAGYPPFCRPVA